MTDGRVRLALAGAWHALGTARVESLAAIPVDGHQGVGARIAIDAEANRHLLVPTAMPLRTWSQVDSPLKDSVQMLSFGSTTAAYLDVRCSDPSVFDVFDDLILDVLEGASEAADPGMAVDSAVVRWRALFRAVAGAEFGRERRYGLFAELLVLEACATTLGPDAVATWTGPAMGSHDFELPHGCLEVKAVGATSTAVTIHGFGQLDPHRDVPLRLLVYTLSESATGRTIKSLVDSIELMTGTGSLNPALRALGFESALDEPLVVGDVMVVSVDGHVPAITSANVGSSDDIRRVEYDIPIAVLGRLKDDITTPVAIAAALR